MILPNLAKKAGIAQVAINQLSKEYSDKHPFLFGFFFFLRGELSVLIGLYLVGLEPATFRLQATSTPLNNTQLYQRGRLTNSIKEIS